MADLDVCERTPLFVACTRPAMKMGVPVEGLMINAGVSYVAALWVGRMDPTRLSFWLCVFLALLVHYSMRWLTGIDHNIFRILCLFVMTRCIVLRRRPALASPSYQEGVRAQGDRQLTMRQSIQFQAEGCCLRDRARSEAPMPSGRFIAEQSTCARDAPGGILQACLEVAKALGEQEDLQTGASCNVEQAAALKLGLNQRRALLNLSLRQLQCARARTPTEFGMKARCFRQVKDSLGEDDTRVAELAVAILDEAVGLFSLPSSEGLNGYLETGDNTSTRTAWRSGLFTRPDLGRLLGRARRSHAGE